MRVDNNNIIFQLQIEYKQVMVPTISW